LVVLTASMLVGVMALVLPPLHDEPGEAGVGRCSMHGNAVPLDHPRRAETPRS
jgi:hypothetical protein